MASLGDLVVKMSLDAAGFQSDMGKAAYETEKGMAQITAAGVLAGNIMTKLAEKAVQAFLEIGKFAFAVSEKVFEQVDALQEAATAAGITASSYQVLQAAMAQGGVSAQQFATGISKLNNAITAAAEGNPKMEAAFKRLGVAVVDSQGFIRDTEDVLKDLGKAFDDFPSGPEKAALSMELLGKSGAKWLNELDGSMSELGAHAQETGAIFSNALVAASDEFEKSNMRLNESMQGLRNTIAEGVLPAWAEFKNAMSAMVDQFFDFETRATIAEALSTAFGVSMRFVTRIIAATIDVFIAFIDVLKTLWDITVLAAQGIDALAESAARVLQFDFSGARDSMARFNKDIDDFMRKAQDRLNKPLLFTAVEKSFEESHNRQLAAQNKVFADLDPNEQKLKPTRKTDKVKKLKDQADKEAKELERETKQWNDMVDRAQEEAMRAAQKNFDDQMKEREREAKERERQAEKERKRLEKFEADAEKDRQKAFDEVVRQRQVYADIFEGGVATFFTDIVQGTKSVSQAFSDMGTSIVQSIEAIIAKKLATALFESIFGSEKSGEGGIGGILSAIVGGYFGAAGGAEGGVGASEGAVVYRASGGPVNAGQMVMVGERGPEMFRAGYSGRIDPVSQGDTVHNNVNVSVNVAPQTDRRSADQVASSVGLAVRRAMQRTQ